MFRTRSHLRDHMRIHTGMFTFMTWHITNTYLVLVFFRTLYFSTCIDDMITMKKKWKVQNIVN